MAMIASAALSNAVSTVAIKHPAILPPETVPRLIEEGLSVEVYDLRGGHIDRFEDDSTEAWDRFEHGYPWYAKTNAL